MIKIGLLILSFFAYTTVLRAQEYEMKSLPINNNGGSNSIKTKIIFDEDGVLWYNTHSGMVKEFESSHIFHPYMDGQTVVPVQKVNDVLLDSKGRFWVTTEEGIFRSDTSKENFQKLHWPIFDNIKGYPALMAEDCSGNIWMAISKTQVLKISSDTEIKLFETAEVAPEDQDKHLHVVHIYDCNTIIMQRGLTCFVVNQETAQLSEIPIQYKLENSDSKMDFEVLENGEIFPKDFEGFYNYNGKKFKLAVLEVSNLQIMETPLELSRISRVKNSFLKENMDFVLFGDGLERKFGFLKLVKENDEYHLKRIKEISFDHVIENYKIANNSIIYVSVFDKIHKIRLKNKGFKKGLHNQKNQDKKINISTRGFLEISEQEFLVATYDGIFKLNLSSSNDFINEVNLYANDRFTLYRAYAKVNDSVILAVGESALLKLNHKKNRAAVKGFEKDFGNLIFFDIHKFTDSTYLLASNHGIGVYNFKNEKLKSYKLFPLASDTAKFVKDIHYNINNLYFSTEANGLFIQNTITNEVINIRHNENQEELPSNYVYTSYVDTNENLWVGTNKGITCFNKERKKLFNLGKQDGLLDENIVGIQEDKLGNIWFSTYKGLYKYNTRLKTVFSYFKEDGLPDNEFNQNSYYTATDGTLFFGGVNGIVSFDTIVDNTFSEIKILPTKIEYFDSKKNRDTIITYTENANNYIRLSTKNSSLSVTFSINDFFNIENNRYLYKVSGLSDGWINLGGQNTLRLFSIPPGSYTLKIKGLNSTGIQSSNELSYNIYVPQVLYKRTWFLLVSIILFIGTFIFIVIKYAAKQKKKYKMNLMLIELEQKVLRAQMNPHFIFNILNGMRKKVMKGTASEIEDYIVTFSNFLRYTLDIGRSENILICKEIQYITSYINLINYDNNVISLHVKREPSVDQNLVTIPSMILQPLVENAVIHGFTKNQKNNIINLIIKNNSLKKQIEIIIEDNGIGINASKEKKESTSMIPHQSYATQIINERFELMNKTRKGKKAKYKMHIEDISDVHRTGTRITISISY
ncbi:sensor histidine kinase [Flavivirga spongiicola]|uniref:Histidine kinase n=1 Tax=Flavivirga spongiicola TaxID=421621 RepID=A0ABU7XYG0_9FLAO|nr:sensor histidine kinase [Flavivirga sp. MEBiC05379]MDO5980830.1 histidine kinase [Flavivirga sp. MEBiC05379]